MELGGFRQRSKAIHTRIQTQPYHVHKIGNFVNFEYSQNFASYHDRMRRGFTLIELLVSIGIVALLIAILSVSLAATKNASMKSRCLANIRDSSLAIQLYASDFAGLFPFQTDPEFPGEFTNGGMRLPAAVQGLHWTSAVRRYLEPYDSTQQCPSSSISREYFSGDGLLELRSMYPPEYALTSNYHMTLAAFTEPRYWSPRPYPKGRAIYRPVRVSETSFPSSKGLLIESLAFHSKAYSDSGSATGLRPNAGPSAMPALRFSVALVDGSARFVANSDFLPGARPDPSILAQPVLHTARGIMGRDLP